jgi:hypothetical protein
MTLKNVSNVQMVEKNCEKLFGDKMMLIPSTRKNKKYMLFDWIITLKFIHFGDIRYKDYTKYLELYGPEIANQHRERYLKRATKLRGDWQDNPFSPNNLSINLLWNNLT